MSSSHTWMTSWERALLPARILIGILVTAASLASGPVKADQAPRAEQPRQEAKALTARAELGAGGSAVGEAASEGVDIEAAGEEKVVISESEQAWIAKHPTVYWAVDPQWPPFSYFDRNGRISGIDVAIINHLARRIPLNFSFVPTTNWTETLQKAFRGEIDIIAGIAHTEEREKLHGLRFTEAYCTFPTAIVTQKDGPFFTSFEQLTQGRVALPKNYATTEELRRLYPKVHILLTETEEESMLLVAGNRADATAINLASAAYLVHLRGLSNLKISGLSEVNFYLCLAVRPGARELQAVLEKGLATVQFQEKEAIYSAYIHPETIKEINWKTWQHRAIYSALIGGGLCLGVLMWNRILRREINRRELAESRLVGAHDRLQAHALELSRHAGELESLNQRLTRANKDLEAFSFSLSHDLNGPVRRIRGFADLVEMEARERLDGQAREYVTRIQQESAGMHHLIQALLSFARTGLAQVRGSRVAMKDLVQEVIAELSVEIQSREIQWNIGPLPIIECDRTLIKQVLVNLLGNAIKFTLGRSPARIEVGVLAENPAEKESVFFVRDNGAGFESGQAETLFTGFHRLHRQEEFEGWGIGLLNVKRIIQKHGGRVWAEGETGKGATFFFSVPFKRAPQNGPTDTGR